AGITSYNSATNTATFTPSAALVKATTYTVNVSGTKDIAGNVMVAVSWSFTTDATAPSVTNQAPAPNATGVANTTTVTATFSENVQQASIVFTLKDALNNPVAGSVSYNSSTFTATFTPSA